MERLEADYESLKKNYDRKIVRKFSDVKGSFKDCSGVRGDPIIYSVYIKDLGTFEAALTVLNAGAINKEFFMTRGHRHKKPRKEIYILIKGKGRLLVQGAKKRGCKDVEMKKGKMYFIPPSAGHRSVNTGSSRMEFMSFYAKDAGHDYNFQFGKRFFRR